MQLDPLTLIDQPGDITTIDTTWHRPGMAASHLIVDDGHAAFVDVGTTLNKSILLRALAAKDLTVDQVDYVMVTHVHLDHAGAAGTLLRALPNAQLVVHPRGARHMIDPTRLIAGATDVYGAEEIARTYGEIAPVPADRVLEARDGYELQLGTRTLLFLDTPGHARHHYSVIDEVTRGIFTGDAFGLSYRDFDTKRGAWIFPTTTPVQFDPAAMHATVTRLMELSPICLYLTHFGRVTQLDRLAADMHRMIDRVVEISLNLKDAENRRTRLESALFEYYVAELRLHQCELPEAKIHKLLDIDVAVNAMGLEHWLDHDCGS